MPHSVSSEATLEDQDLQDASSQPHPPAAAEPGEEMDTSEDEEREKKGQEVNMDELFATDDEDDEFSSSAPAKGQSQQIPSSSPPPLPAKIDSAPRYSDPDIMLAFYQRLFPFRPLFQWLNHSMKPSNDFANREIAFTLQNEAYLRYQSYPTGDLLRKNVLRLNPSRFEIGPVYSTNPRDRKSLRKASTFRPISKELVFDIDLTDYDEIRTCCDKANICHKCWRFVVMAIKVVDSCLREDFAFEHIMWVYSGRRGAHAWISDKRARDMPDDRRRALAGYLAVTAGSSQSGKKIDLRRPLHPHLVRSLDLLRDHFQRDILEVQDPWASPTRTENLLSFIPDKPLADALRKKWESAPGRSSTNKWADIDSLAKAGVSRTLDSKALLEAKKDIILEYTYPRLDVEVSKKLIHLLKSPFVIHPKTGRVCVPIPLDEGSWGRLERFDPLAVPTVIDLLGEIDAWNGDEGADEGGKVEEGEDSKKIQDYEKTSLKPYVDYFKAHVASLLRSERGVKRERDEEGDPMEF